MSWFVGICQGCKREIFEDDEKIEYNKPFCKNCSSNSRQAITKEELVK